MISMFWVSGSIRASLPVLPPGTITLRKVDAKPRSSKPIPSLPPGKGRGDNAPRTATTNTIGTDFIGRASYLFHEYPGWIQQRKCDHSDTRSDRDQQWIAYFPTEEHQQTHQRDHASEPVTNSD